MRTQLRFISLSITLLVVALLLFLSLNGCQSERGLSVAKASVSDFQLPDPAMQYQRLMIRASMAEFGHDNHVSLLAAQTHQESLWRNDLISRVGAIGPSQFMPATAQWFIDDKGKGLPCSVIKDFEDYACALPSQIRYMANLHRSVKGTLNECERVAMSAAKYNGGGIKADRRLTETSGFDSRRWFDHTELFNGRNRASYNFKENREYPRRIILKLQYKYLAAGYRGKALCSEHI